MPLSHAQTTKTGTMVGVHPSHNKEELQLAINQGVVKLQISPYVLYQIKGFVDPLIGAFNRKKLNKEDITQSIRGFVRATFAQATKDTERDMAKCPNHQSPDPRQVYLNLSSIVVQPLPFHDAVAERLRDVDTSMFDPGWMVMNEHELAIFITNFIRMGGTWCYLKSKDIKMSGEGIFYRDGPD